MNITFTKSEPYFSAIQIRGNAQNPKWKEALLKE